MSRHAPPVIVCADRASLAAAVAARIAQLIAAAIAERGRAVVALAGGTTPRDVHEALVAGHATRVDWRRVVWCFGDERLVPLADPRSNFRMARETLLEPLEVDWGTVWPVPTGAASAETVAVRYERTLRALFPDADADADDPVAPTFDLVLLGMGGDGHTASLFPGDEDILGEPSRWVRAVAAPDGAPVRERVTLTLPAIARARTVLFVAAGASKRSALLQVLARNAEGHPDATGKSKDALAPDAVTLPAARVAPQGGVEWWLDKAAWKETGS